MPAARDAPQPAPLFLGIPSTSPNSIIVFVLRLFKILRGD